MVMQPDGWQAENRSLAATSDRVPPCCARRRRTYGFVEQPDPRHVDFETAPRDPGGAVCTSARSGSSDQPAGFGEDLQLARSLIVWSHRMSVHRNTRRL
jgi:hypothetical protein